MDLEFEPVTNPGSSLQLHLRSLSIQSSSSGALSLAPGFVFMPDVARDLVSNASHDRAPSPLVAPPLAPRPSVEPGHSAEEIILLESGTPVRMRLSRTLSSADARVDERVDFEVLDEVKVNGVTIIERGTIAWGTITEAQPKRRMGRAGRLAIALDAVRLVTGERAPLTATKDSKGGGHVGKVTGAVVGTALVFWPAAPLFLLIHGKDTVIPKGTEVTAYINGDMKTRVNVPVAEGSSKLAATQELPHPSSPVTTLAPASGVLEITSTPTGADIEIDGAYVGSTPSSLNVPVGNHEITVSKKGFRNWSKKIRLFSGKATISITLEK